MMQAKDVKLGQIFKWENTYYRKVCLRGLPRVVAQDSGEYCIVAADLCTSSQAGCNVILIHEENSVSLSKVPQVIYPKDMQVGDTVVMSHVTDAPWMCSMVDRIEGEFIYLKRPYMMGGKVLCEEYSEHVNSNHEWILLRR